MLLEATEEQWDHIVITNQNRGIHLIDILALRGRRAQHEWFLNNDINIMRPKGILFLESCEITRQKRVHNRYKTYLRNYQELLRYGIITKSEQLKMSSTL